MRRISWGFHPRWSWELFLETDTSPSHSAGQDPLIRLHPRRTLGETFYESGGWEVFFRIRSAVYRCTLCMCEDFGEVGTESPQGERGLRPLYIDKTLRKTILFCENSLLN